MDIHLVGKVSVEDTTQAHLKDLAVQEKYGVTYHQYWYNEDAGTVYCLMEGPDKESCEATHREANNLTACQIVEVEGGMYDLFMGNKQSVDHGLVLNEDGMTDPGNRSVLTSNFISYTKSSVTIDFQQLKLPKAPREMALGILHKHNGKHAGALGYDCIIAVFQKPVEALMCASEIQQQLKRIRSSSKALEFGFTIGISTGQPLTEHEGFFTKAIQMSHRLCLVGEDGEIVTSQYFKECYQIKENLYKRMRILKPTEQIFLNRFLDLTEAHLADQAFGVNFVSRELGISQPQLYRKIHSITSRSPVNFIRDIRLNKALSLIKENQFNISEIALEVGYNSPSYFSKCFQEKFGVKASQISI